MKTLLSLLVLFAFVNSKAQQWENLNPGGGGQIQGITCDPNTPGRMFLNSDVEGNYRSDDYGLTWRYTGKDLIHHMAFITTVEPGNSNRVYCGTLYGVHVSNDGGLNWIVPDWPMKGRGVATLVVDPTNTNNLYVGNSWYIKDAQMGSQKTPAEATTGTREIWVSKDKGATWTSVQYEAVNGYKQCYTITLDPTNTNRVYLGAHSGLYRSTNGGLNFSKINLPIGMVSCRGFDITPDGKFAYAVFAPNENVAVNQPEVFVGVVDNNSDTWVWTQIASASKPNGLYYANGVNTYYWKPLVDPRSTATLHKVIIGCLSSNANTSQGLYEYSASVSGTDVTGSWEMVFGQSGSNDFNFDMGWNNISPQVRQYTYTPVSWPERFVLLASQQSLYYGNPALPNNTPDKYSVRSTQFVGTFGAFRTYKTRGFQSTVNFDGSGWGNYVVQGMADNRLLESWDGGQTWTQNSRPGNPSGQNCDFVDIIPPNNGNAPLVITAAGGGFGGANDAADAAYWGKYLTTPATAANTWNSLENGTSGLPAANSRAYGSDYNRQDPKNVVIATQNGLYETLDIYARVAGAGGTFQLIGPPAGTIFKFGDVFFDPDNGNVLYANTGSVIYKLTRPAVGQPWTFTTIAQGAANMGGGNFYYWKHNGDSYMVYSTTGVAGAGPRIFLSKNEGSFNVIMDRTIATGVYTAPWFGTWADGAQMNITFSGLSGWQNQIVTGSQEEDGKHGYAIFRGTIQPNGSVTWEDWSGEYGTSNYMEVARLWDGKILMHPDALGNEKTYYYAATRGAGLWRMEMSSSPLPVFLLRFDAFLKSKSAVLEWVSTGEINFSHYEIERSVNGKPFTAINKINAKAGSSVGTTSYDYEDNSLSMLSGVVYYRLKMVDIDGAFRYSQVVSVRLDIQSNTFSLFPNPSLGNSIITHPPLARPNVLEVYSMDGRLVYRKTLPEGSVQNYLTWNRLSGGIYRLMLKNGQNHYSAQFILQ